MSLWSIVLCHCLLRFSIPFRYQSFGFKVKISRHPCATSAILSKIIHERKCATDLKRWKSYGVNPCCKPDTVAALLHRIPPVFVAFFWKYEIWHYLAGTTHGFCWLILGIFLLKHPSMFSEHMTTMLKFPKPKLFIKEPHL